jgi:hypothetical protein
MFIAALCMRVINQSGPIYWPYSFEGEWTDEEKAMVSNIVAKHMPERVDASFNNWLFAKHEGFMARRFTWDSPIWTRTIDALCDALVTYYAE